jgi:hypothetical protein
VLATINNLKKENAEMANLVEQYESAMEDLKLDVDHN